jgi:hypothetical protein
MNRQHGVKAGIIPERLWRRLYIQGMTPRSTLVWPQTPPYLAADFACRELLGVNVPVSGVAGIPLVDLSAPSPASAVMQNRPQQLPAGDSPSPSECSDAAPLS